MNPEKDKEPSYFHRSLVYVTNLILRKPQARYFLYPSEENCMINTEQLRKIPHPIFLYNIKHNVENHKYTDPHQYINDVISVFRNIKLNCKENKDVIINASNKMSLYFNSLQGSIPRECRDKMCDLQRLTELRFHRYLSNKKS